MLHAAHVGALVQTILLVGKVHKPLHQAGVGKVAVVEREHAGGFGTQHAVEVDADRDAFELACLLHGFVNIRLELRKARFSADVRHDPPQRLHALGGDVQLLQGVLQQRDTADIFVDLAQTVDERPQRGSLLVFLEPRHVAQIGKAVHQLLHDGAQLGKTQKVLKHVASVTDHIGIIRHLRHQRAQMTALTALFGEVFEQKIY